MASVMQAAKLAGAHDFILELPEAYDTLVGKQAPRCQAGSASAAPSPERC